MAEVEDVPQGSPAAETNEAAMPEEEGAVIDRVSQGEANEASMESIDDASNGNGAAEIEEEGEGSIEQDDDGDEGAAAPEGTSEGKTEESSQDLDMKSRRDSLIDQSSFGVIPGVASMRDAMFDSSSFAKPAQIMDDGPSHPASLTPNLESLETTEMSGCISSRPATAGGEDGVQLAQTESVPRLKTPGTPNRVTSRPTTRGSARGAADQDGQAQAAHEVLTPRRRQLPVLMASNSSVNLMSGGGGSQKQPEQDAPITLRQTVEIEIDEAPPESSAEKYPSPSTGSMIRPSRRRSDARRKGLSFAPMDNKGLSVASVDLRSSGGDMLSSFSRSSDEPLSEAAILAAAAAADRVRLRKEKQKREMHARLQRMTLSLADKKTRKDKDPDNSDDDEEYEIQPVDEKKQGKYANLLRPLEKQMRIRVPERRSQLLYSDTAFYPNGREKALTALDRQKEERRLELHRRKNLGEERIVGKHIMPRVGMKVMYSFEAVDNHRRPATEGLQGVISAVDDDMLMCSVIWPESEEKDDDDDDDDDPAATGDKEEYCCTGYNNMYFLKIVKKDKEYNMSQARQWALDAILSPRFVPQNHQIWEMSSRHRLIPVGYKERIRDGKNVLNNIKVSVRQDIREWDRERIREEENLAERKRVEKLMRLTKKTVKKQTKKEQELLRQAQFANEAVGNTSTIRKLKASARQQLRDQVVSGEAVHLEDAGNQEVEKLMQGLKFPKLASQTFDDGLPTWMLRPSQPL